MGNYQKYKQKAEEYFEKNRLYVGLFLIVFIVFGGTVLMIQGANAGKTDSKIIKSSDIQQEIKKPANQENNGEKISEEIIFDIEGAVKNPGVYKLASGSVMIDAINKAGGFSSEADAERISRELNQATVIGNNAKLYIFRLSDRGVRVINSSSTAANIISGSSQPSTSSAPATRININSATVAELDTLPKIGPAIAQRIIDWRVANGGFEVLEDLKKVKGIGDSLFDGVKDLITIE
ncbi:MAG TPA: ComEA family DNA-binding protein [Patescibacteria group bacterium]|nr:ComEA family DNA-binding protein [Patescibacteria group bacterium]